MNVHALSDAIGNISDRHIIEGTLDFKKYRQRTKYIRYIAASLILLICVGSFTYIIKKMNYTKDNNVEKYQIGDISPVYVVREMSRTGVLSPLPADSFEKEMTNDDLRRFFQRSDFDLFGNKKAEYKMILNSDNTVHTVRMIWNLGGTDIYAIFEPDTYPAFLFNSAHEPYDQCGGYDIIAVKTSAHNSHTMLDVGMKKDNIGIWIFGNAEYQDDMEILINYILESSISFDLEK